MEKLAQETGIKLTHVPFRGFGPALIGLLRNDVNVLASDIPGALEHVRRRKLRALAVTGSTRMPMLPGVLTVAEVGVPDYEGVGFVGIMVRAGTPRDVIDVLNREINRALASPRSPATSPPTVSSPAARVARGLRRVPQARQGGLDQGDRHRRHQAE